jgi:hypothetical protein
MNEQSVLRLNRRELYDLVWSTPMSSLAKRFGYSDNGLAKVCRRLKVPIPYRGYWARRQHGQEPHKEKLPRAPDLDKRVVILQEPPTASDSQPQSDARDASPWEARIETARRVDRIAIGGALKHPVVVAAAEQWMLPEGKRADCLPCEVSPALYRRALGILDALFLACEHLGWEVRLERPKKYVGAVVHQVGYQWVPAPQPPEPPQIQVVVHREPIGISLSELHRWVVDEPRRGWAGNSYTGHHEPTGDLACAIKDWTRSGIPRRTLRDKGDRKLETILPRFLGMLAQAARVIRSDRAGSLRSQREQRRQEKRRLAREARARELRRRRREFNRGVDLWQEHVSQAAFLSRFHEAVKASGLLNERLAEWLEWAQEYVDRDPFVDFARALSEGLEIVPDEKSERPMGNNDWRVDDRPWFPGQRPRPR